MNYFWDLLWTRGLSAKEEIPRWLIPQNFTFLGVGERDRGGEISAVCESIIIVTFKMEMFKIWSCNITD